MLVSIGEQQVRLTSVIVGSGLQNHVQQLGISMLTLRMLLRSTCEVMAFLLEFICLKKQARLRRSR